MKRLPLTLIALLAASPSISETTSPAGLSAGIETLTQARQDLAPPPCLFARAFAQTQAVPDPVDRVRALADIAQNMALSGDQAEAQAFAELALQRARADHEAPTKARSLIRIAPVFTALGQAKTARSLLQEARRLAETFSDNEATLRDIAVELAKIGDVATAQNIAAMLADPYNRSTALLGIASTLAGAEAQRELAEVLPVAGRIERNDFRSLTLASLAAATAQAGGAPDALLAEAQRVAMGTRDPYQRASALLGVARAWQALATITGNTALSAESRNALGLIQHSIPDIDNGFLQAIILGKLAANLADSGQFAEARATATRIEYQQMKMFALGDIAVALADANQLAAASVLLPEVEISRIRAAIYAHIAAQL